MGGSRETKGQKSTGGGRTGYGKWEIVTPLSPPPPCERGLRIIMRSLAGITSILELRRSHGVSIKATLDLKLAFCLLSSLQNTFLSMTDFFFFHDTSILCKQRTLCHSNAAGSRY